MEDEIYTILLESRQDLNAFLEDIFSKLDDSKKTTLFPDVQKLCDILCVEQDAQEKNIRTVLQKAEQDILDHPNDLRLPEMHVRTNRVMVERFKKSIIRLTQECKNQIRLLANRS